MNSIHVKASDADIAMMTQHVNQTFTMHCGVMQWAGVSKWKSQPMHCDSISNGIIQLDSHMTPCGGLSPSLRPYHTNPCRENGCASLTVDSYTKLIIQSVKSLYMSVEENCQDFSYTSPRVTEKDSGIWVDTFTLGVKCHGHAYPNPHPGTHNRLHEISCAHSSGGSMEGVHHSIGRF